ncbi:MAG TPA: isoprenylcysteine carboxylmethyltransferase family protein [Ferruginibacter sp.]|nr:isoprenylcysteine carboxylmethyltransferase family protein [Ferruginibacter sp.]
MIIQHWILAGMWLLFGILHSLTATESCKKMAFKLSINLHKNYRFIYITVAIVSLLSILAYGFNINSPRLFTYNNIFYFIPIITGTIGLCIMVSVVYKYFITGMALKRDGHQGLITSGLNNFVRHPLYAGTLLTAWSFFSVYPLLSILISNTIVTGYTITGIYFEEKKLAAMFGNEYLEYKKKVPMLFPL